MSIAPCITKSDTEKSMESQDQSLHVKPVHLVTFADKDALRPLRDMVYTFAHTIQQVLLEKSSVSISLTSTRLKLPRCPC